MKQIICIQLYRISQNLKVTELAIYANEVNYPQVKGKIDNSSTFVQKTGQQLLNSSILWRAGHQQRGVELDSTVTFEDAFHSLRGHVPQ